MEYCSKHKNIIEEVKLSLDNSVKSEGGIQINYALVQGSQQRQAKLQGPSQVTQACCGPILVNLLTKAVGTRVLYGR